MRVLIALLMVVLLSTSGTALFGPKPGPPGFGAGFFCQVGGCNMTGPIDMQGNEIINVTLTNVTFNQVIYVNSTQVLNPIWLPLAGGNMTGDIDMGGNSITDVFISWSSIFGFPYPIFINTSSTAGGDISGTFSDLQLDPEVVGDAEMNYSQVTLSDFTNDAGFLTSATLNETDPVFTGARPRIAFTNKSNVFEADQFMADGIKLFFKNTTTDTFFFYNITNTTLQLYVNGKLQQDWGNSTTIYGRATFLDDAIFNNISGNYMLIDTNVLVNGYLQAELFIGNGTGLIGVCLSNGTGCFENASYTGPVYWSQMAGTPPDISAFPNDAGYVNSSGLQAYNDTAYINQQINATNTTANIASLGFEPGAHKSGAGPGLYNDSINIYLNESYLNETVLDLTGIHSEWTQVMVGGGTGANATITCCGTNGEILQLLVVPTTASNKYRFSAYTTIGLEKVDSDRELHTGNWSVAHRGSVVSGDTVTYSITNVQIDELFNVRITWRAG